MNHQNLTGSQKAAILLLSLGDELGGKILQRLDPADCKRLIASLNQMGLVSESTYLPVINEFCSLLTEGTSRHLEGNKKNATKLLKRAFPSEEWVDDFCSTLMNPNQELNVYKLASPEQISRIFLKEHPQTISLALCFATPDVAVEILKRLPEPLRLEVITRMAGQEEYDPTSLKELDETLCDQVKGTQSMQYKIGGKKKVAAILNHLGRDSQSILEKLKEQHSELSEDIQNLMFTFEDLARLHTPDLREVFTSSSADLWPIALRGTSEELKEALFATLSARQKSLLIDDIESIGAQRIDEIEKARKKILEIAKELEKAGKIQLNANSASEWVS